MKIRFVCMTALLAIAGESYAQFLDCSPSAVLKTGVKGIYSEASLARIRALQSLSAPDTSVHEAVSRDTAVQHKNCVRQRLTTTERDIFTLGDKYKQQQLNKSFGAWATNVAMLAFPTALSKVGTRPATFIARAMENIDVTSTVFDIDIGKSTVDTLMDDPNGYINRMTSIAVAQAKLANKPITPDSITNSLQDLLNRKDSPLRGDDLAIASIRKSVAAKLTEMEANAPQNATEEWFAKEIFGKLEFKSDSTNAALEEFVNKGPSEEQIRQAKDFAKSHQAAIKSLRSIRQEGAQLMEEAAVAGKIAKESLATDAQIDKMGEQVLAALDPKVIDDPTKLKRELSQLLPKCQTKSCKAAIDREIKKASFRESAEEFGIKASKVREVATTAAKVLSRVGADPALVRDLSSFASASDSAAKIATQLAVSGSIGPMGWISIAGDLFDMGGALGGMFGGLGGPSAEVEMHSRVMEALASISQQIEGLRKEMQDQFAENRRQLELLEKYSALATDLMIAQAEYEGVHQCITLAKKVYSETDGRESAYYVLQGDTPELRLAAQCHNWLVNAPNGGFAIDKSGISSLFTTHFTAIKDKVKDSDSPTRDVFLSKVNQERDGQKRLIRLTGYAVSYLKGRGKVASGLGALAYSPSNFLDLDRAHLSLREGGANPRKPVDLPELMRDVAKGFLDQPTGSLGEVGPFADILKSQIDVERVVLTLSMGLLVRQLQPYLERTEVGGVLSAKFTVPQSDAEYMQRATPMWMWDGMAMAHLVKVQQVLYRGDYAIPLLDQLLKEAANVPQCKEGELKETGTTLCERFGKAMLIQLTEDARIVIAMFPELRANLAAWRVRQALKPSRRPNGASFTLFPETKEGVGFHPAYGQALAQRTPQRLMALLPNEAIYQMNTDYKDNEGFERFAQDTERGNEWFLQLSGKCSGLDRAARNGRVKCIDGVCEGAEVKKDVYGDWQMNEPYVDLLRPTDSAVNADALKSWRDKIELNCVVAPLPTRAMVETGRLTSQVNHDWSMQIADRFLVTASREINRHLALRIVTNDIAGNKTRAERELLGTVLYPHKPVRLSRATLQ